MTCPHALPHLCFGGNDGFRRRALAHGRGVDPADFPSIVFSGKSNHACEQVLVLQSVPRYRNELELTLNEQRFNGEDCRRVRVRSLPRLLDRLCPTVIIRSQPQLTVPELVESHAVQLTRPQKSRTGWRPCYAISLCVASAGGNALGGRLFAPWLSVGPCDRVARPHWQWATHISC